MVLLLLVSWIQTKRQSVPVDSLLAGETSIETSIPFSSVVKTLGVTLDTVFSFDQHVSAVVRYCFLHVRSLSKVRSYLIRKAADSIAISLILSKLDYCNGVFAGLPRTQIKRLQAAQNAAARTVTKINA